MIDHAVASIPVDIVAFRTQNLCEKTKTHEGLAGTGYHSMTPHPTKPVIIGPDLTGTVFGKFVVVGLSALPCKSRGLRWSCRCQCGAYELRKTASIIGESAWLQECAHCHDLAYMRDYSERVVRMKKGESTPLPVKP